MQRFLNQLIPFIFIGIAIVAFAFGILILAYLFLFGAFIGFILFIVAWIRDRFFPPKSPMVRRTTHKAQRKSGRIIDSDDWKEL